MVPARDQAQAAIALLLHPHRGFEGVADRVVGGVTEHDAACLAFRRRAERVQQRFPVHGRIDAGDEQLAGLARGEQLKPGFKPHFPAGQHDNRIGRRGAIDADP